MRGGFAMAIDAALYERLVYAEDGGFVTGSLFDCALPTANAVGKDFPPGGRRRPGTAQVWISGIALRPDRHPLRRSRGS